MCNDDDNNDNDDNAYDDYNDANDDDDVHYGDDITTTTLRRLSHYLAPNKKPIWPPNVSG